MQSLMTLTMLYFLLLSCASPNLPDSLDKNSVPSELEINQTEEMSIPERDDRPGAQNPLEEQTPELPLIY